jgi:ParB-like chromosome segregation protein Spo0J
VQLSELKENPQNPKIITELGKKRLNKSLSKFGLAGTIIVNQDMSIIDGHSRKTDLEEQGVEEVWVSVPSRPLTEKEYKEFNAIIDIAKAGQPNMVIVEEVLQDELMQEWDLKETDDLKMREVEIKPFVRTHVLLSFPPEKMIEIQELLQKIHDMPFVEYEQSSN